MTNKPRPIPRPFEMPWGKGQIMEEARAVRDHWEPTIQLMEYEDGSAGLRFCFYSGGRFNRSPLILGDSDLDELARELEGTPRIKAMLQRLVG
jgi:hypothetical protein